MRKKDRHRLITRLLSEYDIQKQEDFVRILKEQGIEVTQATISRDIKEMKLVKVPGPNGSYHYSLPAETKEDVTQRLEKIMRDAFVAVDQMEKFVVLQTIPGNASAIANLIDKRFGELLFASVADDDHILMVARTEEGAEKLKNAFLEYL
ncbi:ArgR family transcriptional regulator [Enterococcus canis]|uniref:Arginine repressor n=1 Tax=Enterococcus canis TaxID=214095 RepID=A0A1L8RKG6_9ENTE|nr:arginine repressor [Enterococcus canis]OJG20271.1 ArgR family transcriptional regulator [Enterococcus canis]